MNGFFEFINAYPRLLFYIAECIYQEPQSFCNRTKKLSGVDEKQILKELRVLHSLFPEIETLLFLNDFHNPLFSTAKEISRLDNYDISRIRSLAEKIQQNENLISIGQKMLPISYKAYQDFQKTKDTLSEQDENKHSYTAIKNSSVSVGIVDNNIKVDARHSFCADKIHTSKNLTTKVPIISPYEVIGRHEELVDLHQRLFKYKQVVLINGMGGLGKTMLAQAYLGKYLKEYHHIAWFSLFSDDIFSDVINTEGLLANLNIQAEGKDPEALFKEILIRLQHIEKQPCLLIIDNADMSLSRWYDYLPHQPQWHILVASRERIGKFDQKNLGFLPVEDAVKLFLSHYTRGKIDNQKIRDLVIALDLHTLAIEILAKTAQLQRTEPEELMNAIVDDLKVNVYIQHKGTKIDKMTSYLCSIFTLSKLNEDELLILKQFSCLPSEFQSYSLLEDMIGERFISNYSSLSEILEMLSKKGWLLQNTETDSYKMNRIIAEVIQKQNPIAMSDVSQLINIITEKLQIDQTKDNPVEKFPWIPYGYALLDIFPSSDDIHISNLQNNIALVLKALGDYTGARDLLEKAVVSDEKNFGPDHPNTARSYSNLATVLQDLGDYMGAKYLLEKAMVSDEKNFGTDHPTTAGSYSNLAIVLQDLGDYTGAKYLLEKAMVSGEKNFGPDHPNTARSYSNLAMVLQDLGDYMGAKYLLEKAMVSDEKNFGTDHPTMAVRYSNLATVLHIRGDYETALSYLEKSLKIRQEIGDKAGEGATLNNISQIYKARGDYETALGYLEKSLKIQQEIGDKAGLCATLFNMGHIYYQNEDIPNAIQAWVMVYRMATAMNLTQVLDALKNLADQLKLPGGLEGWEHLSKQIEQEDQ